MQCAVAKENTYTKTVHTTHTARRVSVSLESLSLLENSSGGARPTDAQHTQVSTTATGIELKNKNVLVGSRYGASRAREMWKMQLTLARSFPQPRRRSSRPLRTRETTTVVHTLSNFMVVSMAMRALSEEIYTRRAMESCGLWLRTWIWALRIRIWVADFKAYSITGFISLYGIPTWTLQSEIRRSIHENVERLQTFQYIG